MWWLKCSIGRKHEIFFNTLSLYFSIRTVSGDDVYRGQAVTEDLMHCQEKMGCLDSRPSNYNGIPARRRRYTCKCGYRISTYEFTTDAIPNLLGIAEIPRVGIRGIRGQLQRTLDFIDRKFPDEQSTDALSES